MSVQRNLRKCLKKLSETEFKEFVCDLLERDGPPKVSKKQVQGKNYIAVAKVMVSVFSDNALKVAKEILRKTNSTKIANKLAATGRKALESALDQDDDEEDQDDDEEDQDDDEEDDDEEGQDEDEEGQDEDEED